ncbi:SMI1/KNR4 family protein [Kitasatospora purpeofusca]|uniref:SMI1/KNR4 family protein n=1 Tax=Kitasatospora purpeofusca TaxID=67352 RepID=A0ABZ1U2Y2_9ACTN|nr:SMI1/KNR4 family protein [Kitasatospora purpeofusca]
MTGNAQEAEIADSGVDWSGVREQVLALRDAPFAGEVFGARWQGFGHDFLVEPPLSETELAEAEEELGVSLPPDYRTFLLEVGAGGAGPFYGVFPLRRDEQGWHWLDGKVRSDNTHPGKPFPSTEERARWAEELDAREPVKDRFSDGLACRTLPDLRHCGTTTLPVPGPPHRRRPRLTATYRPIWHACGTPVNPPGDRAGQYQRR